MRGVPLAGKKEPTRKCRGWYLKESVLITRPDRLGQKSGTGAGRIPLHQVKMGGQTGGKSIIQEIKKIAMSVNWCLEPESNRHGLATEGF
jgi:hypothetical protein